MATKSQKAHGIIHTVSAVAAAVGGGLAQIPGSDAPILAALQTAMIVSLAELHGVKITRVAAAEFVLTFGAIVVGRTAAQALVGWVPGFGNAVNAATAAAVTEAIGWAANEYFAE